MFIRSIRFINFPCLCFSQLFIDFSSSSSSFVEYFTVKCERHLSFFLQGRCTNSDCPYLHVELKPNAAPCAAFLRGYCAAGVNCASKHFTLKQIKDERKLVAGKQQGVKRKADTAVADPVVKKVSGLMNHYRNRAIFYLQSSLIILIFYIFS